jgi:hypothetical protein
MTPDASAVHQGLHNVLRHPYERKHTHLIVLARFGRAVTVDGIGEHQVELVPGLRGMKRFGLLNHALSLRSAHAHALQHRESYLQWVNVYVDVQCQVEFVQLAAAHKARHWRGSSNGGSSRSDGQQRWCIAATRSLRDTKMQILDNIHSLWTMAR